ncbi:hypothetical protein [Breoghania sp. JC706]|uniref:hypothetical protein n=1 Tax=Breoghania sp. JC706 TaxID=3117732 RepID=UPI00300A78DD
MRRRLFLHVGLPKTGTSAVQAWLYRNADALRRSEMEYPDAFAPGGDPSHRWLVRGLLSRDLADLRAVLDAASQPDIVLSSEGLTNHLYDFSPEALDMFRSMTGAFDVTVLLATREMDAWLRSYYRQAIINPGNRMSDLWGTALSFEDFARHPRMRQLADHPALINDLRAAYGASHLVRLDYDGDWFSGLAGALGIDCAASAPADRVNESVPGWIAALMLRINRLGKSEPERRLWRAAIQMHCPTGNSVFRQSLAGIRRPDIAALDRSIVEREVRERVHAGRGDIDGLLGFSDFLKEQSP